MFFKFCGLLRISELYLFRNYTIISFEYFDFCIDFETFTANRKAKVSKKISSRAIDQDQIINWIHSKKNFLLGGNRFPGIQLLEPTKVYRNN